MKHKIALWMLWFSSVVVVPASAQTTRARAQPANVQIGTLVSIDTAAATLSLKPRAGAEIVYRFTEKTHFLRAKRAATPADFQPGDTVVVRFRKSSVGPASLYDVADRVSWDWLTRVRRETTRVTIVEITDESLRASEGSDNTPLAYRITDKTLWARGGQPASAADFKAGESVHVAPRLLPGGGLMAAAVSDAPDMTARLKERTRPTVSGTVKACDPAKRTLSLRSAAGDERDFSIAADCLVRLSSRDVPLASVRAGQSVTLHLKRNEEGEQIITRITIHPAKGRSKVETTPRTPATRKPPR
jgi:hypothetical protein